MPAPAGLLCGECRGAGATPPSLAPPTHCPLAEVSPGHGDVPAAHRSLLEAPLQAENYKQKFQLLLYLEEIQMEVDIRRYDMKDVTMEQDRALLVLDVRSRSWGGGRVPGLLGCPASQRLLGTGARRV